MFISRRKLRQTIEELRAENNLLKSENEALNKASEKVTEAYQADMKKFQAEIDQLVKEIERLSRKRDEKGRYIPNFKRGDVVSISYDGHKAICILAEPFNEIKNTKTIAHLTGNTLYIDDSVGCASPKTCSFASKEEAKHLLDRIDIEGYYWDGKNLYEPS